jgi:response regulator NasT
VGDGRAAVELARQDPPDLAILDIRMPEMDGLAAAELLWNEFSVPTIIVSAFSDKRYIESAQEIGVFGYLLKPVSTENLRVTLAIAWARATSHEVQRKRIAQLETTLTNRKIVEQAKWLLIEREGLSEPEAHAKLQRTARNNRRPLIEVALEILDADPGAADNAEPSASD